MNTTYRGHRASQKARCPSCGGFLDDSIRHQACPNCGQAVFILNGEVVDREPRPGTV